jgi:hypothetical protein
MEWDVSVLSSAGRRFMIKRVRFAAMRTALRPLVSWKPLQSPENGYSVIIGCSVALRPILRANLEMLTRQGRQNLARVLLAFDCTAEEARRLNIEQPLRDSYGDRLPLQFIYHGKLQNKVIRGFNWGWTYSWINWSLSLAACQTRFALIHDLDAMLIQPDLLESRFTATRDAAVQYSGTAHYHCNGIDESDRLLTTFEMFCDVQFLRANFKPLDLFNLPTIWKGKPVEFDTLLWAQTRGGRGLLLPISPRDMVHPSQMICQFVAVRGSAPYTPPANNNILMIPYFMELGGDRQTLAEHQASLDQSDGRTVRCFGRPLDFSNFSIAHARWLTEQGHRLDTAVHGAVRPEIRRYFESIENLIQRRGSQPVQQAAAA